MDKQSFYRNLIVNYLLEGSTGQQADIAADPAAQLALAELQELLAWQDDVTWLEELAAWSEGLSTPTVANLMAQPEVIRERLPALIAHMEAMQALPAPAELDLLPNFPTFAEQFQPQREEKRRGFLVWGNWGRGVIGLAALGLLLLCLTCSPATAWLIWPRSHETPIAALNSPTPLASLTPTPTTTNLPQPVSIITPSPTPQPTMTAQPTATPSPLASATPLPTITQPLATATLVIVRPTATSLTIIAPTVTTTPIPSPTPTTTPIPPLPTATRVIATATPQPTSTPTVEDATPTLEPTATDFATPTTEATATEPTPTIQATPTIFATPTTVQATPTIFATPTVVATPTAPATPTIFATSTPIIPTIQATPTPLATASPPPVTATPTSGNVVILTSGIQGTIQELPLVPTRQVLTGTLRVGYQSDGVGSCQVERGVIEFNIPTQTNSVTNATLMLTEITHQPVTQTAGLILSSYQADLVVDTADFDRPADLAVLWTSPPTPPLDVTPLFANPAAQQLGFRLQMQNEPPCHTATHFEITFEAQLILLGP